MRQDNGERCENCKYWRGFEDDNLQTGWCQRLAPVIVSAACVVSEDSNTKRFIGWEDVFNATEHPITHCSSDCGEWQHDGVTWNDKLLEAMIAKGLADGSISKGRSTGKR